MLGKWETKVWSLVEQKFGGNLQHLVFLLLFYASFNCFSLRYRSSCRFLCGTKVYLKINLFVINYSRYLEHELKRIKKEVLYIEDST